MTSEVVLMNNKAVAVAADSVVTVAVDGVPRKTFTGVEKLFEVSKNQPVAMMIYSNAEIMGLPWKTVITAYKQQAKNPAFKSVEEYADDFFKFIDKSGKLFPEKLQREQYAQMLRSLIHTIESRANSVRGFVEDDDSDDSIASNDPDSRISIAVGQIYDRVTLDDWDQPRENLECFPPNYDDTIRKKYKNEIDDTIGGFLQRHNLSDEAADKAWELPVLIITKHYFPLAWPYSGIVFAGFGKGQVYPELCSYEVSNVIGNVLKRGKHIFKQLSHDEPVVIQPFAQDRMIRTLLYGIDPYLESHIIYKTFELVPRLVDHVLSAIPDLSEEQMEMVLTALQDEDVGETINDFFNSIFQHQAVHHMVPIYSAIQALPEQELANTAESLVNLNSFQQRVSLEIETIGGEIDVALMSPSDGFVWVKHPKHKPKAIVG